MDPTYPATLTWTPPDHLSCYICDEPEASPVDNITYYVHATDVTGCMADDSVTIKVELCNIWFPSAFTPNFDGKNDVARVRGNLKWYNGYTLAIYNRYGENVFYTDDIYAGWDGLYKGTPADVGVYFYKISFVLNGERKMLAGDITLIR
jgi:gliding motility-associated-like protein